MGRERARRTWGQRAVIVLLVLASLGSALVAVGLAEVARVTSSIDRVPLAPVLDPPSTRPDGDAGPVPALSFLVVGADGEGGSRDDGDGPRNVLADSMMIVRTTPTGAEVLPLPRDLWGEIPGHGEAKINAAMAYGAADGGAGAGQALLIETIRHRYGLVINHYVEVDFAGFVDLIDDVGGIDLYVPTPARDAEAQLELGGPACTHLDGATALRLARSRHYESEADGDWDEDPTSDLGRIRRQQVVLRAALTAAIDDGVRNPIAMRRTVTDAVASLALDDALSLPDLIDLGQALRSVDVDGVTTYALEVAGARRDGQLVLDLVESTANQAVLDRFRAPPTTSAPTTGPPVSSTSAPSTTSAPPPTTTAPPPEDPLARFTPSLLQPDGRPC